MKKTLRILSTLLLCMLLVQGTVLAEEIPTEEPVPETTAAPAYTLLKSGSKGEEVKALQARLKELGYLETEPDGDFGNATRKAVKTFQKTAGIDADGLAGKETQRLLFSEDAPTAPEPTGPVDVLASDLPMLVNGDHLVDEDFVPQDLIYLKDFTAGAPVKIKYKSTMGVRVAVEALMTMLKDAGKAGVKNWQVSAGYRSYEAQNSLLNNKINSYLKKNTSWSRTKARNAALRTVAKPGASEHHLGLSFDVNVPNTSAFLGTKQCTWLHEHCWEYGFIIRYPAGKEAITGISAEAWHVRYVGVEHSMIMKSTGQCLEEYLESLPEEPDEILTEENE